MDLNNRENRYYLKMAGRIESELGIAYAGRSTEDLKDFIDSHIDQINAKKNFKGRWTEKKTKKKQEIRKRHVLKSAPVKPAGMCRKHGSGQNFQSENT